jgi:hypothetical protein
MSVVFTLASKCNIVERQIRQKVAEWDTSITLMALFMGQKQKRHKMQGMRGHTAW